MITENDNPPEQPFEDTPDMIDMLTENELRESLRQALSELDHLHSYVGNEMIKSDFQTAGDMRRALNEMTESQKRCFAQWTLEAQNVKELENENSSLKSHVKILRDAITSAYCYSERLVKALNETKDYTLNPIIEASNELKDKMDRLSQCPPISFEKAKAQLQKIIELQQNS